MTASRSTAPRLVADVGGTNTRLGLARGGAPDPATVRSYRNEGFGGFADLVERYLAETGAAVPDLLVAAVAGPVSDGRARLTNRDWSFDAAALSAQFSAEVALLNDLGALGHAVAHLDDGQRRAVLRPETPPSGEQALVVGVGTGFNVCPVVTAGGRRVCLRAEYGHTHLPAPARDMLREALGPEADRFLSVEDIFSGRGFQAAKSLFAGARFEGFYAELLGVLAGDLMLAFLPTDGLYFAGGVARGLLTSGAAECFVHSFEVASSRKFGLSAPVWVITDDAAALTGCAVFDPFEVAAPTVRPTAV